MKFSIDMTHIMNTYAKNDPLFHETIEQKYLSKDTNTLNFPLCSITVEEFVERNGTMALLLLLAFEGSDKNLLYLLDLAKPI